jgi:hypothetical protein
VSKHPFEYQVPTSEQIKKIQAVREAHKVLYEVLLAEIPQCSERTLAIRALEKCSFWSNKAIVFDGERYL